MDTTEGLLIPERTIYVVKGKGYGNTEKTAYDSALWSSGIANFNVVPLSSIIPAGYTVEEVNLDWNSIADGRIMECVQTAAYERRVGRTAVAMLGYVESEEQIGIFLELHGSEISEVHDRMMRGLKQMCRRRDLKFKPRLSMTEALCREDPENDYACALVTAIYSIR